MGHIFRETLLKWRYINFVLILLPHVLSREQVVILRNMNKKRAPRCRWLLMWIIRVLQKPLGLASMLAVTGFVSFLIHSFKVIMSNENWESKNSTFIFPLQVLYFSFYYN